jgi:ribose 5-phosphate isomerase A
LENPSILFWDPGARVELRRDARNNAFATDQDNCVLDCRFGQIHAARPLAQTFDSRAGSVEHGLFLQMATDIIVAGPSGLTGGLIR